MLRRTIIILFYLLRILQDKNKKRYKKKKNQLNKLKKNLCPFFYIKSMRITVSYLKNKSYTKFWSNSNNNKIKNTGISTLLVVLSMAFFKLLLVSIYLIYRIIVYIINEEFRFY